jgi:hypothetical protein
VSSGIRNRSAKSPDSARFIETDAFDCDASSFASRSWYRGATRDGWGPSNVDDRGSCGASNENTFVIEASSDSPQPGSRFDDLWVPATATTAGYAV